MLGGYPRRALAFAARSQSCAVSTKRSRRARQ